MRPLHVEQFLIRIGMAAKSGDPEQAHALEDELYRTVLLAISEEASYAGELARAALKSRDLTFSRRCA